MRFPPTVRSIVFMIPMTLTAMIVTSAGQAQPAAAHACEPPPNQAALLQLINAHGGEHFANPPELPAPPTSEANRLDLIVDYANLTVAGCLVHLRTYNNKIVGPTIRAKPGDTIHLRLINKLEQPNKTIDHPQKPAPSGHGGMHGQPFSFNITNLHTHGLHVAPQGSPDADGVVRYESDNVLLEIGPGQQQDYRIHIPSDHPAGTFWYHAHVHGSTAVQLSSGMAGALIIEGGTAANGDLDTIPSIGQAKQKILVFQQLAYDSNGEIEKFNQTLPKRATLINGMLVPVIHIRPGEVQRWRLIHAGMEENIPLALDGHVLAEVAADGITLNRVVPWAEAPPSNAMAQNTLFLAPGYRSDVLVKARSPERGRRYFLRRLALNPDVSIQVQQRLIAREDSGVPEIAGAPPIQQSDLLAGQILAELVIEGDPVPGQSLPGESDLAQMVPKVLEYIKPTDLVPEAAQHIKLWRAFMKCDAKTGECVPCTGGTDCPMSFLVNDRQFFPDAASTLFLKLRTDGKWTAAQWKISVPQTGFHPFHIHVNPFQVERREPTATGGFATRTVWKDTIIAKGEDLPPLRMRYTRFKGKFVLHCHILTHEDQGMMKLVEIVD